MRVIVSICALIGALLGGLYLGFSSCGGVLWHRYAVVCAVAIVTVAAVAVPSQTNRAITSRVLLVLSVAATYVVSRAAAASFYPAVPDSWGGFVQIFMGALAGGTC